MNKLSLILLFSCFLLFTNTEISAQGNTDPFQNRIIAKYYSHEELDYMKANLPDKFNYVRCYYIHSFSLTSIPCTGPTPQEFFLVDVKEFDSYRKENETVSIDVPERGFRITLI